ncbi:uncharacterized protein [Littorina saxatilis]|uniref:uncharacterized protein isoform X2 n=1 Tax=Littorina saxatilis TaxID=31220 RepID=UPI0038B61F44
MAALKALVQRIFGFGKEKNENKTAPPRHHPYDEVTDEQLNQKRKAAPRVHPYDEVSDAVLQENRSKPQPARRHNYDQIDLDRTMSKVKNDVPSNGRKDDNPALNYVDVVLPAGMSESDVRAKKEAQSTVYSEVRASTSAGGGSKS